MIVCNNSVSHSDVVCHIQKYSVVGHTYPENTTCRTTSHQPVEERTSYFFPVKTLGVVVVVVVAVGIISIYIET
jgi:hypothetical protein